MTETIKTHYGHWRTDAGISDELRKRQAEHADAMTGENLTSKAAIAYELASRDCRISDLEYTRDMLLERIRLLTDEPPAATFTST